jgi:hypothetical protein
MDRVARMRAAIDEWCAGRDWRWRAVVLAFLTWQAARPLRDSEAWHVFRGITFGAHEFGHLFFGLAGNEWMAVAGGSLMQLLVPVGAAAAMIATPRKDWFGAVACGTWLAASLADLAPYIGDARAQALDLVSFSPDGGGHDWHYLLAHAGLLKHDAALARGARFAAVLVLLVTTAASVALFRRMARPAASDAPHGAPPMR